MLSHCRGLCSLNGLSHWPYWQRRWPFYCHFIAVFLSLTTPGRSFVFALNQKLKIFLLSYLPTYLYLPTSTYLYLPTSTYLPQPTYLYLPTFLPSWTMWPDWAFLKVLIDKISYKSSPNILWLFGPFWKHPFSCVNCCSYFLANFWKKICYFIFHSRVTLDVNTKLITLQPCKLFVDYFWPFATMKICPIA